MLVKNFFGETLEVSSEEKLENELKVKYGISEDSYEIFKVEGEIFISLFHKSHQCNKMPSFENLSIPNDVKNEFQELGIPESVYIEEYTKFKDASIVKERLLPFTFKKNCKEIQFNEINKSKLLDNYINDMSDAEKNKILKNLDEYISKFSG